MAGNRKIAVVSKLDSQDEINRLVERLLHTGDAFDVFPTPMSRLFEVAKIKDIGNLPDPQSGFIKSLSSQALGAFLSAMQKIRGIADLRERVVYVPRRDDDPRILFAQGHELGHQIMSWHNINRAYQDDNMTLSSTAKAMFEQEANYFSGEAIFKGKRFQDRARDLTIEFNSVFKLAADHGASIQATNWRFVQAQDFVAAVLYYYPHRYAIDEFGNSPLTLWKVVPSPKFVTLCDEITLPPELSTGHPWLEARSTGQVVSGVDQFDCGLNGTVKFLWQSWWNTHSLAVLVRRKPLFRIV